jgi:L-ascorbate metabolism protein UlaG (beta-lactamase superfamily)
MRISGAIRLLPAVFLAGTAALQAATPKKAPTTLKTIEKSAPAEIPGVAVAWLGHACFRFAPTGGPTMVIDPFGAATGDYPWPQPSAKVVLVTHEHFDHNAVERVGGHPAVLRGPGGVGLHRAGGVSVLGVAAYHDDRKGAQRGPDTIYVFTLNKVRFCHLGDLGQSALTPRQLKAIGRVDVLFIPVGGYYTIDARGADRIIAQLKPKVVVPMHYKTADTAPSNPISGVEPFLKGKSNVRRLQGPSYVFAWAALPKTPTIMVFPLPSGR